MAININIPSQVAQTITNGVTGTAPSEDAVFDALALKESLANKGIANGYVPLNASTKVDSSYLPSYVDDVIEVANFAALPVTGETGKIYITLDTNLIYRWSGSIYVQVASGGGGATWGAITGTLSNQTDLQNALDGKFNNPTGTTSQYIKGDGTLGTSVSGTVTSVGLTMPNAFSVANSPITGSGTIAVTGAGTSSQYVRGDGVLANFPTSGGGGNSVAYYLNGSVSQGTFGGNAYYQMSKTPVIGAGTDFTISTNGFIARFITDAGDPALLNVPGGNWNLEFFFNSSSSGGTPTFYVNVYKVSGTTFTLLGTNSAVPEAINNGTIIDAYFTPVAIPAASLLVTDRLAIDIYVNNSGRTIKLHTENSHLCEIITTFSSGLTALNGLTQQVQYLAVGTSGTDFNISSVTDTHTFNLPVASATNTGKLSSTDWTSFNSKAEINPRVQTVTSAATVTPTNLNDLIVITAQAVGLTIANPTGTMVQGQALMIRIKDNATARTITFGTNYRAIGITLPTTTVISKTLYLGCIWNDTDTKFDVVGLNQEA
jgi:hypothetical protein